MKAVTLLASPISKGNTAAALDWAEEAIKQAGYSVERIHVAKLNLSGCLGCFKCQEFEDFRCIQKDDGNEVFNKMASADAVIIATPLYFWNFTAQIKPIIDRFVCQVKGYGSEEHASSHKDKPVGLLATCWGPVENNTESLVDSFNRTVDYIMAKNGGAMIIPGCEPGGGPSEEFKESVSKFGAALVKK